MPQSFRSKFAPSEPADRRAGRQAHGLPAAPAFAQPGAELGAWHHNEAFEHLSARLECLSSRLQQARLALSPARANLLDGVADALSGLKVGIAGMRRTWDGDAWPAPPAWSRVNGTAARPASTEAGPWDAETAEALTRICEVAAVEDDKRGRGQRPRPAPGLTAAKSAAPQTTMPTQALEARLAALAEGLQQALPRLDPAQWLGPIDARIVELERELATALQRVSVRCEANGLSSIEAMIRDLVSRTEHTGAELARLDAIEGHLREMVTQLKEAAGKPRAALPATQQATPQGDRTQTLEGLLKACAAARRQDARTAVGVLQSIHQAIADIVERLDAQANNDELSFGATAFGGSDPHADHDLLLKAYREGARALGQSLPDAAQEPGGRAAAWRHAAGAGPLRWPWQTKE